MLNTKDKISLFKTQLINKLLKGDGLVFEFLIGNLNKESELYFNSVQLNIRFNRLKSELNRNLIKREEYNIRLSRINNALIDIVKKINRVDIKKLETEFRINTLAEALQLIERLSIERDNIERNAIKLKIELENKENSLHEKFVTMENTLQDIQENHLKNFAKKEEEINKLQIQNTTLNNELEKYKLLAIESEVVKNNSSLQNKVNGLSLQNELDKEKYSAIIEELENKTKTISARTYTFNQAVSKIIRTRGRHDCHDCDGKGFYGINNKVLLGIRCNTCRGTGSWAYQSVKRQFRK